MPLWKRLPSIHHLVNSRGPSGQARHWRPPRGKKCALLQMRCICIDQMHTYILICSSQYLVLQSDCRASRGTRVFGSRAVCPRRVTCVSYSCAVSRVLRFASCFAWPQRLAQRTKEGHSHTHAHLEEVARTSKYAVISYTEEVCNTQRRVVRVNAPPRRSRVRGRTRATHSVCANRPG